MSDLSKTVSPEYDLQYKAYAKEVKGLKILPHDHAHNSDVGLDHVERVKENGVQVYKRQIVHVALFGVGRIGFIHFRNMQANLSIKILYCIEASEERANFIEFRYNCQDTKFLHPKDADIIFKDARLDAVVICTPTATHEEVAVKALKAKKAVFCEKPLAHTYAGMAKCYQLAKEANVALLCAFNRRFDPSFIEIRERTKKGEIGQIHVVKTCSRDSPFPSIEYLRTSGGIFHDCGVHDIDLICWIVGEFPTSVASQAHTFVPEVAEFNDFDTVSISMKFPSGIIGIIDLSRNSVYGYDQRLEVFGSKGMLSASELRPNAVVTHNASGTTQVPTCYSFVSRYADSYKMEIDHFVDCVNDPEQIGVKGYQALAVSRIAEMCEESARSGKIVNIVYDQQE